MSSAYKPLWGLLAIILGVVAVTTVAKRFQPTEVIPWRSDFDAARAESGRSGKPLLAYFTASWCGPCERMKHTTWADPAVDAALRGYVPVKIDVDQRADLAEAHGVSGIPAYLVISPDGRSLKTGTGGRGPSEFLHWLTGGGGR